MYKIIAIFILMFLFKDIKCQVSISINSLKKLDTLEFRTNQNSKIILLIKNNQIVKIHSIIYNQLDGFQYFFTNYILDSIVRYKNNVLTHERYINSSDGKLKKIYLRDGILLDSNYINIYSKSKNEARLFADGSLILFEYDSTGKLYKISDVDSSLNKRGESIEINAYSKIFHIKDYSNDISLFFVNGYYIIGVYDFHTVKGYNIRIVNRYKSRTVKRIDIYTRDNTIYKSIKIRKNGKVREFKANSKLIF